jgi:hypothetical protein
MLRSLSRTSRGRVGVGEAPGENLSIGYRGHKRNQHRRCRAPTPPSPAKSGRGSERPMLVALK